ncbi:hypothetical protein BA011_39780 (plasmid) [Rhizobium leguminosarum]|uniref:Uncharacterized protein n=1 Tax=Rhizobium leguminosarum TaxID=384 RepID=A0A1B1CJX9_RHILE|nr:hypothetical protein BA011_39780 [Rhizobium leguminosarum]
MSKVTHVGEINVDGHDIVRSQACCPKNLKQIIETLVGLLGNISVDKSAGARIKRCLPGAEQQVAGPCRV